MDHDCCTSLGLAYTAARYSDRVDRMRLIADVANANVGVAIGEDKGVVSELRHLRLRRHVSLNHQVDRGRFNRYRLPFKVTK